MKKFIMGFLLITAVIGVVLAAIHELHLITGSGLIHSLYLKVARSHDASAQPSASGCGAVTRDYAIFAAEWRRNCVNRCLALTANSADRTFMTTCRNGCAFMLEEVGTSCQQ